MYGVEGPRFAFFSPPSDRWEIGSYGLHELLVACDGGWHVQWHKSVTSGDLGRRQGRELQGIRDRKNPSAVGTSHAKVVCLTHPMNK